MNRAETFFADRSVDLVLFKVFRQGDALAGTDEQAA